MTMHPFELRPLRFLRPLHFLRPLYTPSLRFAPSPFAALFLFIYQSEAAARVEERRGKASARGGKA
jgi:hypothetical protein